VSAKPPDLDPEDHDNRQFKAQAWIAVVSTFWWVPLLLIACAVLVFKAIF
jgi:hypothetical protein